MGNPNSKKKPNVPTPKNLPSDPEEEPRLGIRAYAGVVLIGGALLNVPGLLKIPKTTEDQMMLVIVAAMFLAGLMLIFLPDLLHRK